MKLLTLLLSCFLTTHAFALENENDSTIDIDLVDFCKKRDPARKIQFCETLSEFENRKLEPITFTQKDDDGKIWKIRFHFGYTNTSYDQTTLHINSDILTATIPDVRMVPRTSNSHYNPASWYTFERAFKWVDEPTNTFTLSFEKGKNIFYITMFHPKYLKSIDYSVTETNGQIEQNFNHIDESDNFSTPIPAGSELIYLGNTEHNMIWQIGYGRQFVIFDAKKSGKLSYTVKGDVGISTGMARSVNIIPGHGWNDYNDDYGYQGYNTSIGHRLEYQRGKVSLFVDQKKYFSHLEHGFFDGTVEYNLNMNATTFGIGVDLFSKKKRIRRY